MRLFIASILTLAIHLLSCLYGYPGKEIPALPDASAPAFRLHIRPDGHSLRLPWYPFHAPFTVTPSLYTTVQFPPYL